MTTTAESGLGNYGGKSDQHPRKAIAGAGEHVIRFLNRTASALHGWAWENESVTVLRTRSPLVKFTVVFAEIERKTLWSRRAR